MKSNYLKLSLLGIGHLLVDLAGIYLVNRQYNDFDFIYIALFFVIYNFIAFGLQPVFGYLADKKDYYFLYIIVGSILPIVALHLIEFGIIAVIISTIGNAMFHVGGGVICMNMFPKKAAPAGIFVAPGAIGVFLGIYFANMESSMVLSITLVSLGVLLLSYVLLYDYKSPNENKKTHPKFVEIIILIFGIVFIRGLIGCTLIFTWKLEPVYGVCLVIAVFMGKLFGGVLGDRFGYKFIGLGGLFISGPLLLFGLSDPVTGMAGALFFNLTMAITLFLIIDSLGKYKGFAFGLTTLALFISTLPSIFNFELERGYFYYIFMTIFILVAGFLLKRVIDIYEESGDEHV